MEGRCLAARHRPAVRQQNLIPQAGAKALIPGSIAPTGSRNGTGVAGDAELLIYPKREGVGNGSTTAAAKDKHAEERQSLDRQARDRDPGIPWFSHFAGSDSYDRVVLTWQV